MDKQYRPRLAEEKIYKLWERAGAFKPVEKGRPYTIILPPPNANGSLHTGHAMYVIEDVLARYHRMQGRRVLWLPGADHAGFETQIVYEKKLEAEGRERFKIPREKLYKEMMSFVLKNKSRMYAQLKKLGFSLDWSRERFTLDPKIIKIVYATFKQLYDDGLIYRGERIVNWCTFHQTSLSDLEVTSAEQTDSIYYVRYQIKGSKDYVTVATTRPETIFADQAIAIHPRDPRARKLKGKYAINPLNSEVIPIVTDEAVDPEFGTGMVKITPAHDPLDFEIGERHRLSSPPAVDFSGHLTAICGRFEGLSVSEGRETIARALKHSGALEREDAGYEHAVMKCYKCGTVIEPLIRPQWFVAMTKTGRSGKNLRNDAVKAYRSQKFRFVTKRFDKVFLHWMNNLKDWNISRQIVWGIQIPVWYCDACGEAVVSEAKPARCPECTKTKFTRDPDVFDTWFSSGQWPFATLQSLSPADFKTFYPTAVMETGYDILFFWVARMIMLGLYATGEVPFRDIYLHGLVRDKDKRKMSKSKGNTIDPLGVIDTYGADALRAALIAGNAAGADVTISEDKIAGYRNFANKLWNIARFVLETRDKYPASQVLSIADKAFLHRVTELHGQTTKLIENYNFGFALQKAREFIWSDYADWYLEESKKSRNQGALEETLRGILITLHPFMPYVTESIWLEFNKSPLITSGWKIKVRSFPREDRSIRKIQVGGSKTKAKLTPAAKSTLQKDLAMAATAQTNLKKLLSNREFLKKAPAAVIANERSRLRELAERIKAIQKLLK